jgi:nickel transport protein
MKYSFILLMAITTNVSAHGLHLFANLQQNHIDGRAYYVDQTPASYEQVFLYDSNDKLLQKALTSQEGTFRFKIDKAQNFKVVIQSDDGHRAETQITVIEKPNLSPLEQQLQQAIEGKLQHENPPQNCKTEALEKNLISILQQEMQILKEQLHHYENKIRGHDVLGGLGYIFGLAGFFMYILTKRKT